MFKLLLLFILFTLFSINYFFSWLHTIPDFKFISHFNLYEYIIDKFNNNRDNYLTWFNIKYATNSGNYILDYSWVLFQTDLHFLSKTAKKLSIYIPVIIVKTWENILLSWDKIFENIKYQSKNKIYTQYISWWNDYIYIWKTIENWIQKDQSIFLNYLYIYCNLSNTWWIDAYYYDRYKNNKKTMQASEIKTWKYVCWDDRTETQEQCFLFPCIQKEICSCNDKWWYYVCENKNWWSCNTTNCLDYITWTINLNITNCAFSGLQSNNNPKSIYFKLR